MERNKNFNDRRGNRIIGGLIIVAVGAALLLRNTGFYMPNWLFTWPMILILLGIYSGIKHNFRNSSWFILIAIGGFFLVNKFIPELRLEPYFWPIVLIIGGILFMFRSPGRNWDKWNNWNDRKNAGSFNREKDSYINTDADDFSKDSNDYFKVRSVFSGINRSIVSKNLQGGRVATIFGGAEIDLSQAEINGKALINFEVMFGGVELIIPSHWDVQNEIDGIFHGIEDKRRFNPDAGTNHGKILVLKGSVMFGGVEIKSY